MRQDKRTRDQLLAEIDRLRRGSIIDEVGQTLRWTLAVACIAFVAWCMREAVRDLAGLQTNANISVGFLGKIEVAATLSMVFGVGGVLYGVAQRSLRRKTVKRLQARIQLYERRQDPRRSSSELAEDGTTNPEDR